MFDGNVNNLSLVGKSLRVALATKNRVHNALRLTKASSLESRVSRRGKKVNAKCLKNGSKTNWEQQGTQSKFPARTKRTSQVDLGLGLLVKYRSDGASKVKPHTLRETYRDRREGTTLRKKRWADNADATLREKGRVNRQQTTTATTTPTTATERY
ncbi:unnamed protein product [Polarella glacialis]|uniref:Uncharacterized protein n=1 Tax=Polarella glacialis TaxID=89957 RepID=A0A813LKZ6_POLGL|nr:unnamed protein product [Polarella glacialis]